MTGIIIIIGILSVSYIVHMRRTERKALQLMLDEARALRKGVRHGQH